MSRGAINEAIQRVVEGEEEPVLHDPDDIRIAPPKDPEVNPEIYRDVESLIFRGFLTLVGEVGGVRFVFKSMNHHEFETLQWVTGGIGAGKSEDRYYTSFISYGVFMVDGHNVLTDRARWIPQLDETFSGLPHAARSKIVRYLSEVNRRASNAVVLAEAYQMELSSRFRWAQLRGLDLMSTACTGTAGTEQLGMNFGQLVWRALNHYEDLKEQTERDWDHAKFIGGCFVGGKEIRKVQNQDQERRKKEREDRLERKDKVIRQAVYGESPDDPTKKTGPIKFVARTVEELASQLERDLRGEKDWHDEVVAREEERLRQSVRDRQRKLQELVQARDSEDMPSRTAHTELVGLTKEQVQQHIRARQLEAQRTASKMVYPEMMDERMGNFLGKYMDPEDTYQIPGAVRSDVRQTDRDPSKVPPLPPPRPRGNPFGRR